MSEFGPAEVEFVKPVRNYEFCNNCTRMRITSTGLLKPCLMRDDNYTDIISGIRQGKDESYLDGEFLKSVEMREPYWTPEDVIEERVPEKQKK